VPRVALAWDAEVPGARWQVRDATLCFADVSGFTALSERLARRGRIGAEELTTFLDGAFGAMLDLAWRRGASLLAFGGDALLLLFEGDGHPAQAVSAAVECRGALRAATAAASMGRLRIGMSVGVHSGPVHLWRVGRSHDQLLVAGPAATEVCELEGGAERGEIVVSDATARALPGRAVGARSHHGYRVRARLALAPPTGVERVSSRAAASAAGWLPGSLRAHLGRDAVEPEHRMASVAFVALSGVDALLANQGPDACAAELDAVVTTVQRAATDEAITLLAADAARDGAKLICVAGAPDAHDDDEGRLLRAARRIVDGSHGGPLTVRVGAHRGHVYAGQVGTSRRATYTVMGDTVNIAARLAAAAPAGGVLASSPLLDRSRTLFTVTTARPVPARGRAEPVIAVDVGEEVGPRPVGPGSELPFAGRAREIGRLTTVLDGLRSGRGSTVVVTGPTGVGKSRLIDEALARTPAIPTLVARADPYGARSPYRALRDPVRSLLGITGGDRGDMGAALRAAVDRLAPALVPWLPLLADVTHVPAASTVEVDELEPRYRPLRLAEVFVTFLERANPGPLAIVVEDAQWLDEASEALVEHLAAAAVTRPWALVVARRPDDRPPPEHAVELVLEPLEAGDLETIVHAVTAAVPLPAAEVTTLVERSAGNPLFLDQLLHAFRSGRPTSALPESIDAVVNAEIDALPPLARRVLRVASVLGPSFRREVLGAVLAGDRLAVDDATRSALAPFLDAQDDERVRFRHALLHDVAYEGLSYRRRRELHLRALAVLEAMHSGALDTMADVLALHAAAGQDHERAWRYATAAGRRAFVAYANLDAAAQFRLALDAARTAAVPVPEVVDVLSALGDAYERAGSFGASLEAYRRGYRLASGDAVRRAELLLRMARARERANSFSLALRDLTTATRLLDGEHSGRAAQLRARISSMRALMHQAQERPQDAMREAERAAAESERAGDALALARSLTVLDWARQILLVPQRGESLERAFALYMQIGDLEGQGNVVGAMGTNAYFEGRWDDAVALYERAGSFFRRCGNPVQEAIAHANLAEVRVNQGRFDEAKPLLEASARTQRAAGFIDGATFAEVQLARVLAARGEQDAAIALLERARADLLRLGQAHSALEAATHLADCLVAANRGWEALELLDDAVAAAGREAVVFAPGAAAVRGRALATVGERAQARAVVDEAIAGARRGGLRYELAHLLLLASEFAGDGDATTARSARTEAHEILAALGVEH
jgi:class 3 adenylate cyclase/tetratricopeptide (TPR) repeat protein